MTVIAWDGRTLAADKQSTVHGYAERVTKIHRVPGGLLGLCGAAYHAVQLLDWFREGRPAGQWPAPRDPDDNADAIFVTDSAQVFSYSGRSSTPMQIESQFTATGCGRDYALAAMYLGHDARKAVEVACALDIHCGQGIDTLQLAEFSKTSCREPAT